MDASQLRELIRTILIEADLYSEDAVELLMMTAAVESRLGHYIKQINGPARGIFQMEPATEKDLWQNYLEYRPKRAEVIARFDTADDRDLWYNLGYQILLARMHYVRVPEKLPPHNDLFAMARYWKDHYNTYMGAGTVKKAVEAYERYCLKEE